MTELQVLNQKINDMEKAVDEVLPLMRETITTKDCLKIKSRKKIGLGTAKKQSSKVWKEKMIGVRTT